LKRLPLQKKKYHPKRSKGCRRFYNFCLHVEEKEFFASEFVSMSCILIWLPCFESFGLNMQRGNKIYTSNKNIENKPEKIVGIISN
jgi:hypothetical protein